MGGTLQSWLTCVVALSTCLSVATDSPLTPSKHGALVDNVAASCPEHQEAFDGSCYELVRLQRTFSSAQGWCERGGGHLPYVLNDETQQFLQKYLDPEQDWWLGLAPAVQNLTSPEGFLSWLDGSDVSYANWVRDPLPGAGCGYVLRDSGFLWEASDNCSQELYFICEFESGRALACAGYNATLQCGSGRVIQIDDGFYGRKSPHYCQAGRGAVPASAPGDCSWVDVVGLVSGNCHGLQACQVALDVASLGEPCPRLGSYLSVEYHCKDGLHLLVSKLAAVFDNVTISVKWLLHPFQGNLTCSLSAGDGHTVDPYSPEKSESSIAHQYTRPGVFMVGVECTTSEWHVTAQKTITIQEPIGEFGIIRCYSLNQSGDSTNCKALYGSTLTIQAGVEAGTNITYRLLSGETVVGAGAADWGRDPENITVDQSAQEQLGLGCHRLTLLASNQVTPADVSTTILACFLEPVGGLGAWILSSGEEMCTGSEIRVNVSLAQGSPAQVHLWVSDGVSDGSVYEMRAMMNSSCQEFSIAANAPVTMDRLMDVHMKYPQATTFQVNVRATNDLSEIDMDVGNITVICNSSQTNESDQRARLPRDKDRMQIEVSPEEPTIGDSITLQVVNLPRSSSDYTFTWECSGCKENCDESVDSDVMEITRKCRPEPFVFVKYTVRATAKSQRNSRSSSNEDSSLSASKCVIVSPKEDLKVEISCSACDPVNVEQDLNLQLTCEGCQTIKWFIEDTDIKGDSLSKCYNSKWPGKLHLKQRSTSSLQLTSSELKAAKKNIKVVVLGRANGKSGSDRFVIRLKSNEDDSDSSNRNSRSSERDRSDSSDNSRNADDNSGLSDNSNNSNDRADSLDNSRNPDNNSGSSDNSNNSNDRADSSDNSRNADDNSGPSDNSNNSNDRADSSDNSRNADDNSGPSDNSNNSNDRSDSPGNNPSSSSNEADPTAAPLAAPICSINPEKGSTLIAFVVSCSMPTSDCSTEPCTYCLATEPGKHILCGPDAVMKSVFLPKGDEGNGFSLTLYVTVENTDGRRGSSSLTAEVKGAEPDTLEELHTEVSLQVSKLQQQGELSGITLAHMYQSVSQMLNEEYDDAADKSTRIEIREEMVANLTAVYQRDPISSSLDVVATAVALEGVTHQSDELTDSAQMQASTLLSDLSTVLLSMNKTNKEEAEEMKEATGPIVLAASNIFTSSATSSNQREISSVLINTMGNVQSALLAGRSTNEEPIVYSSNTITVYVDRMKPGDILGHAIDVEGNSTSSFSFPPQEADLPSTEPVDVRMMSFASNPFSWHKEEPISGTVGSLSLTREDGSVIAVANLSKEIEIFLPRADAPPVNSTFLDLGNFSTVAINVTTPTVSLVLRLEPSEDIPLLLLFGPQEYPNDTSYEAETRLPHPDAPPEEKYTWVLSPQTLTAGIGVYYLVVKPVVGAGVNSTNATVSITTIAALCQYWDEAEEDWKEEGCRVGPRTTAAVTQCFCNHLTFFGSSFFVMPNTVDVSRTAELFATFADNPVVVCFVGSIVLAYLLAVVWAWRKDKLDTAKVKVTVLQDNDPLAQYRYMLHISTGHRRGASTSAQVTVTLTGSEGESEPHHLTDPDKPVFGRGDTDMFLLTTPFSLGELQSIRLWHDNSGSHPAWYVDKVMVQDLETGQKWFFLCSSWLAIDVGDFLLDKVFSVASEAELKAFSNLFFMKTAKDFRDSHIWFSVVSRPPSSNFTRVQRVSCCFSLLLCTMLTSIMFYGVPTDPAEQKMDLGQIEFTWQQVMIGIQSSIIMFPINLLIVTIFRSTKPRERKPKQPKSEAGKQGKTGRVSPSQPPSPQSSHRDITPDAIIKDIKRIAQSLYKTMKSPSPKLEAEFSRTADINALLSLVEDIIRQHNRAGEEFYSDSSKKDGALVLTLGAVNLQERPDSAAGIGQRRSDYSQYLHRQLLHVEKELEMLGPARFLNPVSHARAVQQVQDMKGLLKSHLSSSGSTSGDPPEEDSTASRGCCKGGLPWWFVFVGWLLVLATSGVSAYFTMIYGLSYGLDRSVSWLVSMVVSFFESIFITQPLKVLGFAAFFALVLKKFDQEDYGDVPMEGALVNSDDPNAVLSARRDSTCSFYQPPPPTDIEKMRSNMIKEQKVFALIREILAYVGFLWMLLLVAYGQRDPNAYFLNRHIRQSFSSGIPETLSEREVFTWANTTLLSNLFGEYPGFITDGNNKLVGGARIRQVRVQSQSCTIARSMRHSMPDCHAPYSWDVEDFGSYGPGWNRTAHTNTSLPPSPWQYQSQSRLRAPPTWGSVVLYRGGGFVADLGSDMESARRVLQYLFDNTWLDQYTRAVFVEFTVYNANINLFCIVTLMMETMAVGAFQYHSDLQIVRLYQATGGLHIFVMASEVIYFLFILYYMYVQGKLMKQQKWAYFRCKWNLLELGIIILSWSALSVFIKRTLLGNRDIEYYQSHKDQFASFYETAAADAVLGYLIAFLVLLATVKLWHLLRLNPKLHMITATLQRAWNDISGFIIVMAIMFLAYSIASNLMFGWKLYSYRTLMEAAQTMVSLQLGIFNYEEVLDYNPVLGAFLIGTCIVFMTFVVVNLFISVILVAFSEEQQYHKPSEEEEIVDLMLLKVCSLFGISRKKGETDGGTDSKENGSRGSAGVSAPGN
ncbi:hypothetical protein GJAV_G00244460 [Gymnothorax javanicus]|nr:hypothetical protein GJAV_G00244460 [Gymnothorax javanicus]